MQLGATDSRVAVRWWWIVAHANSRRHVPWRKGVHVSLEMSIVCVRSLAARCLLRAGLPIWFQVEAGGLRVCCCTAASCHCASSGAQTQTLSVLDFVCGRDCPCQARQCTAVVWIAAGCWLREEPQLFAAAFVECHSVSMLGRYNGCVCCRECDLPAGCAAHQKIFAWTCRLLLPLPCTACKCTHL